MNIVLSHSSALEALRNYPSAALQRHPASQTAALPERVPTASDIEDAAWFAGPLGSPLHVLVKRGREQRRIGNVASHGAIIDELPRGSLLRLGESDVFASAPELLLPQLGTIADRIEVVRTGCELCGRYSILRTHPHGFYSRDPLTTVSRMSSYLDRAHGMHGAKTARWALKYVLPGSESPRETIAAMFFELPCMYGGSGLARPSLNHEIVVKNKVNGFTTTRTYRIDLYWPSAKLGLEYDSDLCHTGSSRIASDAMRRNDLEAAGITMLTLTNAQIKSLWELNKVASAIAERLGSRIRPRMDDYPARQRALHAQLLREGL